MAHLFKIEYLWERFTALLGRGSPRSKWGHPYTTRKVVSANRLHQWHPTNWVWLLCIYLRQTPTPEFSGISVPGWYISQYCIQLKAYIHNVSWINDIQQESAQHPIQLSFLIPCSIILISWQMRYIWHELFTETAPNCKKRKLKPLKRIPTLPTISDYTYIYIYIMF